MMNKKQTLWDDSSIWIKNDNDRRLKAPEPSEWCCFLFGSRGEYFYRPEKGNEPNWFWRWMQYLCFGNRWRKNQ